MADKPPFQSAETLIQRNRVLLTAAATAWATAQHASAHAQEARETRRLAAAMRHRLHALRVQLRDLP